MSGVSTPRKLRIRWILGRVLSPLLYAAAATLVVASVQTISTERLISGWERDVLSWLLLHRPSRDPDPNLSFVALDTELFERQQIEDEKPVTPPGPRPLSAYRVEGCRCQASKPRRIYTLALDRLTRWGAKVVVLDIMFSEGRQCAADDPGLAAAIEQSGSVVMAAVANTVPLSRRRNLTLSSDVQISQPQFAAVGVAASPVVVPRDREYAVELRQTTQNIDTGELEEYGAMAWETICLLENRMPEETQPWTPFMVDGTQPRLLGSFFATPPETAQATTAAGGTDLVFRDLKGNVQIDDVRFRKHVLINFTSGAQEGKGRYPIHRLSWLLSCSDADGRARFADRIVLIGDPAQDRHVTLVGEMPGTEVLANAISSLRSRKPLRAVPTGWVLLLMFGTSVLSVALIRETPARVAAAGVFMIGAGIFALSTALIRWDWWILAVSPLATVGSASALAWAWESGRFQETVAKLAPPRIRALADRVGGFEEQEASVLFSDIRGYTTISETMAPAQVLTYLNRYMSGVDDILRKHGGSFISCPGDCVVAVFLQERRGGPHQERAIRCGLEMLQNVARFREEWNRETGLEFAVGVGINSGPMAIGWLEARSRIEATIIGDAVNAAARIESLTKEYGSFLVSEETLAPVRDRFEVEDVGAVTVKGRAQPIRLYRITGLSKDGAART